MPAPTDRVQLHKQESAADGGDAADSDEFLVTLPLEPNEDAPEVQGLFLQPPAPSTAKDEDVYLTRDAAGNMVFRDAVDATERTISDFLTGGSGITESEHRDLDQLVHNIAEDSFDEVLRTGFLVSDIITWTDAGKTQKIREQNIIYTGFNPTQITYTQYDAAGVAVEIVVETISYTGFLVDSITRTKTL